MQNHESQQKQVFSWGKILSWALGSLSCPQYLLELQLLPMSYSPPNSSRNSIKPAVVGKQCMVCHRHRALDWILPGQLVSSVWIPYTHYVAGFPWARKEQGREEKASWWLIFKRNHIKFMQHIETTKHQCVTCLWSESWFLIQIRLFKSKHIPSFSISEKDKWFVIW